MLVWNSGCALAMLFLVGVMGGPVGAFDAERDVAITRIVLIGAEEGGPTVDAASSRLVLELEDDTRGPQRDVLQRRHPPTQGHHQGQGQWDGQQQERGGKDGLDRRRRARW